MKIITLIALFSLTTLQLTASDANASATEAQKELTTAADNCLMTCPTDVFFGFVWHINTCRFKESSTKATQQATHLDPEQLEACFKTCPADLFFFPGHNNNCPFYNNSGLKK